MSEYELLAEIRDSHPATAWPTAALQRSFQTLLDATDELRAQANAKRLPRQSVKQRRPQEHETLGLTHPFYHDLRSRGVGLVQSRGKDHDDTGGLNPHYTGFVI